MSSNDNEASEEVTKKETDDVDVDQSDDGEGDAEGDASEEDESIESMEKRGKTEVESNDGSDGEGSDGEGDDRSDDGEGDGSNSEKGSSRKKIKPLKFSFTRDEEKQLERREDQKFSFANVIDKPLDNLAFLTIPQIIDKLLETKPLPCLVKGCKNKNGIYGFCKDHKKLKPTEKFVYLSKYFNERMDDADDSDEKGDSMVLSRECIHSLILILDITKNNEKHKEYLLKFSIMKNTDNMNIVSILTKYKNRALYLSQIHEILTKKNSNKRGTHGKILILNSKVLELVHKLYTTDKRDYDMFFGDKANEIVDLIEKHVDDNDGKITFDIVIKTVDSPETEASTIREIIYFKTIQPLLIKMSNASGSGNIDHFQTLLGTIEKEDEMDLVLAVPQDGISLGDYIKRTKKAKRMTIFYKIFAQLASLLDNIHSLGYLHGDLKPNNIIILPDDRVYFIDFGAFGFHSEALSIPAEKKIIDVRKDIKDFPRTLSTIYASAPEIFTSNRVSFESEVWSLGMVMCEFDTEKDINDIFDNDDDEMVHGIFAREIASNKLGYEGHFNFVGVPEEHKEFINKMLQYNPKNRISLKELLNHKSFAKFKKDREGKDSKEDNKESKTVIKTTPIIDRSILDGNKDLSTFFSSLTKFFQVEFCKEQTSRLYCSYMTKKKTDRKEKTPKLDGLKLNLVCCMYLSLYILEQWEDTIPIHDFMTVLNKPTKEEFYDKCTDILKTFGGEIYMMAV